MAGSGLGFLLRNLRDSRGLSLREASELAKLDHAYIHRLEAGEKSSPSDEALKKLIKVLKPNPHQAELLDYLVSHSNTNPKLVEAALNHPEFSIQAFAAVDGASFRGIPLEPVEMLTRMQQLLDSERQGG